MRDAGHRTPDAGHRTSDIGQRTSDIGHRTAKKAKIIYPPPRGVDIIISSNSQSQGSPLSQFFYSMKKYVNLVISEGF